MKTQLNAFDPIVPKKGDYPYVNQQPVYSSSLTPGIPAISSASLECGKCRIKIKFPTNVDVKDTYTHFVGCNFLFFEFRVKYIEWIYLS